MGKPKKYNSRQLTDHLRKLAAEAHDWSETTGVITKGEALATLLFNKALGFVEKKLDDEGNTVEVIHKPESWAIQLVYDRMEGRTPQAVAEDDDRPKALDKVRDLARDRVNALTKKVAGSSGPPPLPKKPKK